MVAATLAIVAAAVAALCAGIAVAAARRAGALERALHSKLVRHQLLVEEVAALDGRLTKLAGRFYRGVRTEREEAAPEPAAPETAAETRARLRMEHGLPKLGAPITGAGE